MAHPLFGNQKKAVCQKLTIWSPNLFPLLPGHTPKRHFRPPLQSEPVVCLSSGRCAWVVGVGCEACSLVLESHLHTVFHAVPRSAWSRGDPRATSGPMWEVEGSQDGGIPSLVLAVRSIFWAHVPYGCLAHTGTHTSQQGHPTSVKCPGSPTSPRPILHPRVYTRASLCRKHLSLDSRCSQQSL